MELWRSFDELLNQIESESGSLEIQLAELLKKLNLSEEQLRELRFSLENSEKLRKNLEQLQVQLQTERAAEAAAHQKEAAALQRRTKCMTYTVTALGAVAVTELVLLLVR
jgi:TolA-binding protein